MIQGFDAQNQFPPESRAYDKSHMNMFRCFLFAVYCSEMIHGLLTVETAGYGRLTIGMTKKFLLSNSLPLSN